MKKILLLPGDGIGPEVIGATKKIIDHINLQSHLFECEEALIGGVAIDGCGTPLPPETVSLAKESDGVLLGAVGGDKWDHLANEKRPERGLISIRSELKLYANLRPAISYPSLHQYSSIKPDVLGDTNIMFVRELIGGLYYGQPRLIGRDEKKGAFGLNTTKYYESEIKRIAIIGLSIAGKRKGRLVSIDKANVLEVSRFWRQTVNEIAKKEFPKIKVEHMYVDNAAMQLVLQPKHFDLILCPNMFGDILSDLSAAIVGSIGLLPSASIGDSGPGLYEPIHGSAPDIAGKKIANPLATILSFAMMLRHSLQMHQLARSVETAVERTIESGCLTPDLNQTNPQSTLQVADKVIEYLDQLLS